MNPTLVVLVVGLTPSLLGEHTPNLQKLARQGGMRPLAPVLPAVTCTVQSTLVTGLMPFAAGPLFGLAVENDRQGNDENALELYERAASAFPTCVGALLNLASLLLNSGMPVDPDALVSAGLADRSELSTIDPGPGRHLERDSDLAPALGDVVPVPPLLSVVSFGDLIVALGAASKTCRTRSSARRRSVISVHDPM